MRRTRLVASLAVASAASASLMFAAPALAYPPSDCTASSSDSFAPGQSGTITGCGFADGEQVDGYAHSARVFLGSTIASASGKATLHFTIPASLPPGDHTVQLVGERSGHAVSEPFTVPAGGTGAASSAGGSTVPGSAGGSLPFTGANDVWQLTLAGAALVGVGGALLIVRRRRNHTAAV